MTALAAGVLVVLVGVVAFGVWQLLAALADLAAQRDAARLADMPGLSPEERLKLYKELRGRP